MRWLYCGTKYLPYRRNSKLIGYKLAIRLLYHSLPRPSDAALSEVMRRSTVAVIESIELYRINFLQLTISPFLYQTRTILAERSGTHRSRFFRRNWQARSLSTTHSLCKPSENSKASGQGSINPFVDILGKDKKQKRVTSKSDSPLALSTLTGPEREIFQRLLRTPSASEGGQDVQGGKDIFRDQEMEDWGNQSAALDALLDDTLKGIDLSEEFPQEDRQTTREGRGPKRSFDEIRADFESFEGIERFDFTLSREYGRRSGVPVAPFSTPLPSRVKASQSLREALRHLTNLFGEARTDVDIWNILNQSVFKEMRDVNKYLETAGRERGSTATTAAATTKNGPETSFQRPSSPEKDGTSNDSSARTKLLARTPHKETSPIRVPDHYLPALNIYGPALLYGLRLLRVRYPQSPWALHILPTIKALGAMSYVLAASTDLYNELLYIKWMYYRDLNGCAALLEEMMSRDLYADRRTILLWAEADNTRRNESQLGSSFPAAGTQLVLEPINLPSDAKTRQYVATTRYPKSEQVGAGTPVGSLAAGWWRLEGVQVGWNRWTAAKDEAIQRLRVRNETLKKIRLEDLEEGRKEREEALRERQGDGDTEPDVLIVEPDPGQMQRPIKTMTT